MEAYTKLQRGAIVSDLHGKPMVGKLRMMEAYNRMLLPRSFYEQPTAEVARALLGKVVVVWHADGVRSGIIVETEAYLGEHDAAAHSYRGKTPRNAAMFGEAGHAYVYFSYGVHWMLNFVTQQVGCGEAVLIRAVEPLDGVEEMRASAGYDTSVANHRIGNGPGKLAKALGVTREMHDGADLCEPGGLVTVCDVGREVRDADIVSSRRIGITKAAELPLRFYLVDNASVSKR